MLQVVSLDRLRVSLTFYTRMCQKQTAWLVTYMDIPDLPVSLACLNLIILRLYQSDNVKNHGFHSMC